MNKNHLDNYFKKGFSLVELSIVLLIIAAISTAIYVGTDLIENARENTIIADFQKFKLYTDQFKEKYDGYPGDLSDATTYFGEANTNNGDGNNIVNRLNDEKYLAWQHLAFAGYIEGPFTGNNTSETVQPAIGFDVPESPIAATPYLYQNYFEQYPGPEYIQSNFNAAIILSNYRVDQYDGGEFYKFATPSISPISAYNIDSKMDDGIPTFGLIRGSKSVASSSLVACYNYVGEESSTYLRSVDSKACALVYKLQ
jgi:prepilin-type N-terminal cleavage/methylation domain-containing protein